MKTRSLTFACALLASVLTPAVASAAAPQVPTVIHGDQVGPYLAAPSGAMSIDRPQSAGTVAPNREFTPAQVPQAHAASVPAPPAPIPVHAANPDASLNIKPLPPVSVAPHYRSGIQPDLTNLIAFPGFDNSVLPDGPADPSVAAGPSYLVETVNESMGIFAKTSGVQYSTTLQSWFGRTGDLFDPHSLYDPNLRALHHHRR